MRLRRVCAGGRGRFSSTTDCKKYSRMPIFHLNSLSDPGVEVYSALTEAQLRSKVDPSRGVFIAESPKVIHVALDAGYEPLSLLCEERHLTGDAADVLSR